MDALIIKETTATPMVLFDPANNNFELKGCSRPEDVRSFYTPIIRWLETFCESLDSYFIEIHKDAPVTFKFKFDYFNSSSAKFILDILILTNQLHQAGLNMRIDWFYDENDDDMREVGEELSEVVDFPFKYMMIKKATR